MLEERTRQLTLDVGGEAPLAASFRVSGHLTCFRELPKGADVRVSIIDSDGEIVASGEGFVSSLNFKEIRKGEARWTERQHGIKVE